MSEAKVVDFKKSPPAVHFGRVHEAAKMRNIWHADLPAGTTPEQVLEPTYWKHLTQKLRPLDIIEAVCEDGSWEASYRVEFVSTVEVHLTVRGQVVRKDKEFKIPESASHEVRWINASLKWGVFRKDASEAIKSGFRNQQEAYRFIGTQMAS